MELDYVKLKEIKPALSGYIRESRILLNKSAVPSENTIHDVRVLMKKSRALLKLLAPQLSEGYIKRDIAELREIGRILSAWRETSVHRKTLREFRKKYTQLFSQLSENEILNSILEKPPEVPELTPEQETNLENISTVLNKTGYRIRFESMDGLDPQQLFKDLEATYEKVTNIYLTCRNTLKPETLHKFRKRTKDFLYQLYVFRPVNPSKVKSIEKRLEGIAHNLGKYNDIQQIINALNYDFKNESNLFALDELVIKFREAQDEYLSEVWPQAYKIFCPGQKLVNVLGFKLLVI